MPYQIKANYYKTYHGLKISGAASVKGGLDLGFSRGSDFVVVELGTISSDNDTRLVDIRGISSELMGSSVIGELSKSPSQALGCQWAQEQIEWAAHAGMHSVVLSAGLFLENQLTRLISWFSEAFPPSVSLTRLLISVHMDQWDVWNRLRTLCNYPSKLFVYLDLGIDSCDFPYDAKRWLGEPVSVFTVESNMTDRHQDEFILSLIQRNAHPVFSSPRDSDPFMERMSKYPPLSAAQEYVAPYYDSLQLPLQPLADHMENTVYETFEADRTKYDLYEEAVFQALTALLNDNASLTCIRLAVVGAGRGGLIDSCIRAIHRIARPSAMFDIVGVEKNPHAARTLAYRAEDDKLWRSLTGQNGSISILHADMRQWSANSHPFDIIVSELLGSLGDNEASPECLESVIHLLHPTRGISIPRTYQSFLEPISSHKVWTAAREENKLETPLVVLLHSYFKPSGPIPLFEFCHALRGSTNELNLTKELAWTLSTDASIHGFAGYFHAELFGDVVMSINPQTATKNMVSWFPAFLPIRTPILVKSGETLILRVSRVNTDSKMWLEWTVISPHCQPVNNSNGSSHSVAVELLRLLQLFGLVANVIGRCGLDEAGSMNIFMAWHGDAESIRSFHVASVESVLYHYPSANLVLIGKDMFQRSLFGGNKLESVTSKGYCVSLLSPPDWVTSFFLLQLLVYKLQIQFGGLYVPFDGGLLNKIEYVIEQDSFERPIFMEILIHAETRGFTLEEFDQFAWKRSETDVVPGRSFACALHCLRFIPRNCSLAKEYTELIFSDNPDFLLTSLIRENLKKLFVLPSWLTVESKFLDKWTHYGARSGFTDSSTDLFSPRQGRYRYDYWYVTSQKLWLPWFMAPSEESNVVEFSVVSLVRKELSLQLFSDPFAGIFSTVSPSADKVIRTPLDQAERLMTVEQLAMRNHFHIKDAGLPGPRGGYKTFGHIRFVGEERILWIETSIESNSSEFECISPSCARGTVSAHTYSVCGSQAEVNDAIAGLTYKVNKLLLGDSGSAKIVLSVFRAESCRDGPQTILDSTSFNVLETDIEKSVTVVAHSGGRCDLLNRLERSLRLRYNALKLSVTCECEDPVCVEEPILNTRKSSTETSWYDVPNDFGLSRGKSFLISSVSTEFVLVLDDDFTFGFASCIECLVMKMKSNMHSSVLPLDIVGFPILEDERMFGAFRGSLKHTDSRLSIEPYTHSSFPDGCMRMDICPMVFLARTERIAKFKWDSELAVGEHELFFYANKINGIQVAVCGDASFIHGRVKSGSRYDARRSRQGEFMSSKLSTIGNAQTYYFFTKYSHQDEKTFQKLIANNAHPYLATTDSVIQRDVVPGPFRLCYFGVISEPTEAGRIARFHHRQNEASLYNILKNQGICEVAYLVPAGIRDDVLFAREFDEMKDILIIPSDRKIQLKFLLEFFSKYMFHWLFFAIDRITIEPNNFIRALAITQDRDMKVIVGESVRGISRDLHFLISHPMLLMYLAHGSEYLPLLEQLERVLSAFPTERLNLSSIII